MVATTWTLVSLCCIAHCTTPNFFFLSSTPSLSLTHRHSERFVFASSSSNKDEKQGKADADDGDNELKKQKKAPFCLTDYESSLLTITMTNQALCRVCFNTAKKHLFSSPTRPPPPSPPPTPAFIIALEQELYRWRKKEREGLVEINEL